MVRSRKRFGPPRSAANSRDETRLPCSMTSSVETSPNLNRSFGRRVDLKVAHYLPDRSNTYGVQRPALSKTYSVLYHFVLSAILIRSPKNDDTFSLHLQILVKCQCEVMHTRTRRTFIRKGANLGLTERRFNFTSFVVRHCKQNSCQL